MNCYKSLVTVNNNSNEVNITDYEEESYLYYVDSDADKTVNIYDYKNNILKRDNNSIYLELKFDVNKKTKGTMEIKELDKKIDLDIETKKLIKTDKLLEIRYILNDDEFIYKIEVGD